MAMNNLPPQAYTRDTLAAAYEWLKNQPISIREMATNADSLVSLFLQSRRRATMPMGANSSSHVPSHASANVAPSAAAPVTVSSAAIGSTVTPTQGATPTASQVASSDNGTASLDFYNSASFKRDLQNLAEGMRQFEEPTQTTSPSIGAVSVTPAQPPKPAQPTLSQPQAQVMSYNIAAPTTSPLVSNQISLDLKTLEAVQYVQSRLNLSSESEALRALVALGFEKIKNL